MINFLRILFLLPSFLLFTGGVWAYNKEDFEKYKTRYPGKIAVVLAYHQSVSVDVNPKTGELDIFETDYKETLYLDESARFYTEQSIYTSDFFEDIVKVEAIVYDPKGKKYKLKSSDFRRVDSPPSSWVFHDDDKELIFDLDELGEGYRSVISYTKRVKRPEFFDLFHFMSVHPVEKAELSISYPESVKIGFYEQNLNKYAVEKTSEKGKKGLQIDRWKLRELEGYKNEEGSTNIKNHVPHLIAQIKGYTFKGETHDLVGNPDQLHGFFQEFLLLKEDENNRGEMNNIVRDITEGMDTDLEKMDTIFKWVQANIKYIAFEDGINGYVPRACGEVMRNRYGDCKDMGNLLVEMLGYARVPGAHVAWVGTRDIPYLMNKIPTPLACNHVICVVDKPDGGFYYLDATNSQGGYILPPYSIQEKDLLIHNGVDQYELFTVPAVSADRNYVKSVIHYYLDEDDSLRGSGTDYYGGFDRENRTYYLNNMETEDLEEYVKEMVLGGFNRYTLKQYNVKNLAGKNTELTIDYDFSVDNLFIVDGEELILNPILFKPRVTKYNEEDHSMARFKKYHRTVDYTFVFDIPEGYEVKHLPEDVSYAHDLFSFDGRFRNTGKQVEVQVAYQYHLLEIAPELYQDWNAFSKAIDRATIQNIILKKK